ncbi:hypothetical protein B0T19DRAFT_85691 [Cercophora scortea]|uniref:Uncharacterized protein n=1 Tax=Cercophora scortea TaxID=314031 RepID=A0AAE0IUT0_9PEZI|nr:hypothetical protein B0T19DRAFT_85691 [Cercophora scortea]
MDPLPVQLLDASVEFSSKAYGFIKSLKHARDDIRVLAEDLAETERLMRDLQLYCVAVQRSPSSVAHHRAPPDSIVQIARQFSEDLDLLRRHLPSDLSPSVAAKVKFVIGKKSIKEIAQRLEQRKTAAALALEFIGRLNDISLRDEVLSLHGKFDGLAANQTVLAQNLEQRSEELSSLVSAQSQSLDSLSSGRLSITVGNPDLLGRIVRAELKQQLEPLSHRLKISASTIDGIALAVSGEASRLQSAGRRSESPSPGTADHEERGLIRLEEECTPPGPCRAQSRRTPETNYSNLRSKEVILSTHTSYFRNNLFRLLIHVETYRYRYDDATANHNGSTFFRIRVDIIPQPWLLSAGLSVVYSSGQNAHGYYDICPSILPTRVLPIDSPIWHVFMNDDVSGLKELMRQHRLTIRDHNQCGYNILMVAIMWRAAKVIRYFLLETPYGEVLVNASNMHFDKAWYMLTFLRDSEANKHVVEPQSVEDILHLLESRFQISSKPEISYLRGWFRFYLCETRDTHQATVPDRRVIDCAQVLQKYGATIDPFELFNEKNIDRTEYLVNLYLATGGSPNQVNELGGSLLLVALYFLSNCRIEARSPRILVSLIRAGADIHYIGASSWISLFNHAEDYGVGDLWVRALSECGYDVLDVFYKSERRKRRYYLLDGVVLTGVDINDVVDECSTSGLRRRVGYAAELYV